jgi:hypothetical protein
MQKSLLAHSIPTRTLSLEAIRAGHTYWADLSKGRASVQTVRLISGLPRLWLCTNLQTKAETVIYETAFGEPQPAGAVGGESRYTFTSTGPTARPQEIPGARASRASKDEPE